MTLSLQFRDNFPRRQVYATFYRAECVRCVKPPGAHGGSERVLELQASEYPR
jgi:hypothetical protein